MKPFRIHEIEVDNLGPFGHFSLIFPTKKLSDRAEIQILTGENGVGKSTILDLISRAFSGTETDIVAKSRKSFSQSKFTTFFSDTGYALSIVQPDGSLFQAIPSTQMEEYKKAIRYDTLFSFAAFAYSSYRRFEKATITSIQEITTHPLENALDFHQSINPTNILQWVANNIAKEAIAKNQNDEKGAKRFKESITQLENAIAEIIGKPIRFIFDYNPMAILIEVNHERLDFNLLPDGLKSIISWLADLLMRMDRVKWVDDIPVFERNFILFLDEIEVHMHPRWQRKILPAVQGLFPNAQIFISTHSPFVINSVDGAWIHRLVKPNGDSQALEPVLSEDGKSISMVLDEIFGVSEQFGEAVERDLKIFYELRNSIIKGETNGKEQAELVGLAKKLQGQSTTLDQIVAMEIRQLNRVKNLELTI